MDENSPPVTSEADVEPAGPAHQEPYAQLAKGRAAVALVFLWAVFGVYRVDIVEAIHDGVSDGAPEAGGVWGIAQLGSTAVFIASMWPLKRYVENADGDGRRYWGWWWTGAAAILSVLGLFVLLQQHGTDWPAWAELLGGVVGFAGMVLLLISGLNADPAAMVSHRIRVERPRDWARVHSVLPIAAGVMVLTVAEALWFPFEVRDGVVKEDFFHEVLTLVPILLIALGVELKFFRGSANPASPPDVVLRAAPIVTGVLMVIAILLAASTLTYDHDAKRAAWHVYIAFAISVQAASTGLIAVVWHLLAPRE